MKKMLLLLSVLSVVIGLQFNAYAYDGITVKLNNRTISFDVQPFIEDGRTLVPIRAITEAMGCDVQWRSSDRTAVIENDFDEVTIKIDSKHLAVTRTTEEYNDEALPEDVLLDVPAVIRDDRTYVPLRALSEAFGADVEWKGNTKTVDIFYEEPEIVDFEDAGVEYCARSNIADNNDERGIYTGPLTEDKVSEVTSICSIPYNAYMNGFTSMPKGLIIESLEDIKRLPNVEKLGLVDYGDTDIDLTPILYKKTWDYINLFGTNISDDSVLDDIKYVKEYISFPNLHMNYHFDEDDINYREALSIYRSTRNAIESALSVVEPDMTEFEKYKALHDYLAENMQYDYDAVKGLMRSVTDEPLYIGLVEGVGICAVYSSIYEYLCHQAGLYCEIVDGEAFGVIYDTDDPSWMGHAWNIVKIGRRYYHVDVTWDDEDEYGDTVYEYFLLSDRELEDYGDHIWDRDEYPSCDTEYDEF